MGFPSEYIDVNTLFNNMSNCRSTKISGVLASRFKEFYCIMVVKVKIRVFLMLVLGFGNWCFCTPVSLSNWKDQTNDQALPTNVSNTHIKQKKGVRGGRTTSVMKQTITFLNGFLCSIWFLNTIHHQATLHLPSHYNKQLISHSLHAAGVRPTPLHTSPVVAT